MGLGERALGDVNSGVITNVEMVSDIMAADEALITEETKKIIPTPDFQAEI